MAERRRRGMRLDDLFLLRWAMEPAIDSTGTRVAFAVAGLDASADRLDTRVDVVDIVTGTTSSLRSAVPTRHPRWSPDGTRLAVRTLVDDRWRLAVLDDLDSAPTPIVVDGDVEAFDWAADGIRLVWQLRSAPAAPRQLLLVDVISGGAHPLLPPDAPDSWGAAWAPVGERVAFAACTEDGVAGVWIIDAGSDTQPALLAAGWSDVQALAWSPDGSSLAVIGRREAATPWTNRQLWLVAADTGARRQLGAALDRSIGQVVRGDDERGLGPPSLAWTTDGTAVLALVANGGSSSILAFDVNGDGWAPLPATSGAMLEFDVARGTGAVAYTWSGPRTPGELSVLFTDGAKQQCSDLAAPLRDQVVLAPTEHVNSISDGKRIDGWLTTPGATTAIYPLVLQVHGGPHYPVGERFSYDAQRLAALGFAVLRANPRGSQGYGEEFAAAVAGDWGGGDVDDLLSMLDDVAARHPIDRERIAIVGESYGAFVALSAIARGDRFAAAVAENSVADFDAAIHLQPDFWHSELGLEGGDGSVRRVRSPVELALRMTAPLLLIHAEDDAVSPIAQSEAMAAALARCGRPVELVRIAGADHFVNVFGRPSQRVDKLHRVDTFLRLHLDEKAFAPT